jgi:hypothetical protein
MCFLWGTNWVYIYIWETPSWSYSVYFKHPVNTYVFHIILTMFCRTLMKASELDFRHKQFNLNTATSELNPGLTNTQHVPRIIKYEASRIIMRRGEMSKLNLFFSSKSTNFYMVSCRNKKTNSGNEVTLIKLKLKQCVACHSGDRL